MPTDQAVERGIRTTSLSAEGAHAEKAPEAPALPTGNLGKMQILKYGYNLRVKFITYRHGGGVLVRRDNFLVKGTYEYDLDRGRSQTEADFWWEQVDNVVRYLVFENGASFTVVN